MTTETIIFPRCGLSYGDLLSVTEKPISLAGAARKLGVSSSQLERVAAQLGLKELFVNRLEKPDFAFPDKFITVAAVRCAAEESPNLRATARKLKVSERQLFEVAKRHGIVFQGKKPRALALSMNEVKELAAEGYTQKDAAYVVDLSPGHFRRLVRRYRLSHLFPTSGQAAAISRRGYAEFF